MVTNVADKKLSGTSFKETNTSNASLGHYLKRQEQAPYSLSTDDDSVQKSTPSSTDSTPTEVSVHVARLVWAVTSWSFRLFTLKERELVVFMSRTHSVTIDAFKALFSAMKFCPELTLSYRTILILVQTYFLYNIK